MLREPAFSWECVAAPRLRKRGILCFFSARNGSAGSNPHGNMYYTWRRTRTRKNPGEEAPLRQIIGPIFQIIARYFVELQYPFD